MNAVTLSSSSRIKHFVKRPVKRLGVTFFELGQRILHQDAPKIVPAILRNGAEPIQRCGRYEGIRQSLMRLWRDHRQPHRYLKPRYSLETLFAELERCGVSYVVLRWFEELPELLAGEDVDLLVDDDDVEKLDRFLAPYEIPNATIFDVRSISGLAGSNFRGSLPYFPWKLGKRLLENRVMWKELCHVPSKEDHFLSLAYHVVYHKAEKSGIPVNTETEPNKTDAEHDYGKLLQRLAIELGFSVEMTLEALHDFLNERGFSPSADSTRKLGQGISNWLMRLYPRQLTGAYGPCSACVTVFLVRQWAAERGLTDFVTKSLERQGFEIVFTLALDSNRQRRATELLRGGNWNRGPYPVNAGPPAVAVVAVDQHPVVPSGELATKQPFLANERVFLAKKILRDYVNRQLPLPQQTNFLHSCDDQLEVQEYLDIICPDEQAQIYRRVAKVVRDYQTSERVLAQLSRQNQRAKVELIEWRGQQAVKKTFKTGRERFLEREVFAHGDLSRKNHLIAPLLDHGRNFLVLPCVDLIDPAQKSDQIRETLPEIVRFLMLLYDDGYAHLDFKPENLLFAVDGDIKVIDFEFLQPYEIRPPTFENSYDLIGPPSDFTGDLPTGGHRLTEQRWQNLCRMKMRHVYRSAKASLR